MKRVVITHKFQFQMVRLKDQFSKRHFFLFCQFQFQMVRLKARLHNNSKQLFISFNSKWFD